MNRILIAAGCAALAMQIGFAVELNDAEFQRLHQELQPSADDAWRTIPWKTAVLDAQQASAKQHKPIFIWAMDGHPLGCT